MISLKAKVEEKNWPYQVILKGQDKLTAQRQRNYWIDILKIMFTIEIVFFHAAMMLKDDRILFSSNGSIGVEFFFLVSGWLLFDSARIIGKKREKSIAVVSKDYIAKRYFMYWGYHFFGSLMYFIIQIIVQKLNLIGIVKIILRMIPNIFMIQMTGLMQYNLNSIDWYLSVLIISIMIIFPLLLLNYDYFSFVVSPIIVLFIMGYLCRGSESLSGVEVWNGFFYKGFLRGFSEMLLGGICCNLSYTLSQYRELTLLRRVLTFTECMGYIIVLVYATLKTNMKYDYFALFVLCVAISISFSEMSYMQGIRILRKYDKSIVFLSKLSLCVYVCQAGCGYYINAAFTQSSTNVKLILFWGMLLAMSLLNLGVVDFCRRRITEVLNSSTTANYYSVN